MNHTPLPFYAVVNINETSPLYPLCSIFAGEDRRASIVCNHVSPEDAEFIVRACNNHDALLGFAKDCALQLGRLQGEQLAHYAKTAATIGERIIAQAEGGAL